MGTRSNRLSVPTIYVLSKIKKYLTFFHMKITIFTAVKYCSILHGYVCVMRSIFDPTNEVFMQQNIFPNCYIYRTQKQTAEMSIADSHSHSGMCHMHVRQSCSLSLCTCFGAKTLHNINNLGLCIRVHIFLYSFNTA